jgi:hypothetical protein
LLLPPPPQPAIAASMIALHKKPGFRDLIIGISRTHLRSPTSFSGQNEDAEICERVIVFTLPEIPLSPPGQFDVSELQYYYLAQVELHPMTQSEGLHPESAKNKSQFR